MHNYSREGRTIVVIILFVVSVSFVAAVISSIAAWRVLVITWRRLLLPFCGWLLLPFCRWLTFSWSLSFSRRLLSWLSLSNWGLTGCGCCGHLLVFILTCSLKKEVCCELFVLITSKVGLSCSMLWKTELSQSVDWFHLLLWYLDWSWRCLSCSWATWTTWGSCASWNSLTWVASKD